jgi:hypothetical protein
MKDVKVSLSTEDIETFDRMARQMQTSRSEVIRHLLRSSGFGSGALHRVTTAIRKRFHGVFTAQQAEQAAAVAIVEIATEMRSNPRGTAKPA